MINSCLVVVQAKLVLLPKVWNLKMTHTRICTTTIKTLHTHFWVIHKEQKKWKIRVNAPEWVQNLCPHTNLGQCYVGILSTVALSLMHHRMWGCMCQTSYCQRKYSSFGWRKVSAWVACAADGINGLYSPMGIIWHFVDILFSDLTEWVQVSFSHKLSLRLHFLVTLNQLI